MGFSLFCCVGSCFYLKNNFSLCIWFQCLAYVSYTLIASHAALDTITALDDSAGQTLQTKRNFLMLKNIRTSTELMCSELMGNQHPKVKI